MIKGDATLVKVKRDTWEQLMRKKIDMRAKSVDEVIKYLLEVEKKWGKKK